MAFIAFEDCELDTIAEETATKFSSMYAVFDILTERLAESLKSSLDAIAMCNAILDELKTDYCGDVHLQTIPAFKPLKVPLVYRC